MFRRAAFAPPPELVLLFIPVCSAGSPSGATPQIVSTLRSGLAAQLLLHGIPGVYSTGAYSGIPFRVCLQISTFTLVKGAYITAQTGAAGSGSSRFRKRTGTDRGLLFRASDRGEFPVRRGDARGETERLRNSGPAVFHEFGAVQFCGAARVCIIRAKRAGSWAGLGELPVSGTGREGIPDRENTKGIVAKDSVIHPVRRASPGRRPCRWWTDARRRR